MTNKFKTFSALLAIAFAFMLACDKKEENNTPTGDNTAVQSSDASLPSDLFVTGAPANARGVLEIKKDESAKGDVVIKGRIGGRVNPFVDGAAVFLLTDAALKSCDQLHGDACKTPWDYCCENPESLTANTATIQITGENGKPLPFSVKGKHGLNELATVTIAGKISTNEDGRLVVDVKKIYVAKAG